MREHKESRLYKTVCKEITGNTMASLSESYDRSILSHQFSIDYLPIYFVSVSLFLDLCCYFISF